MKKIQVITDKEHLGPTTSNQLILIKNRQNTKTYENRLIDLDLLRYLHTMHLMTHQDIIYNPTRAKKKKQLILLIKFFKGQNLTLNYLQINT